MNATDDHSLTITLRIPGAWSDPGELLQRLPAGFHMTPETLSLPDGTQIEFFPMPADDQFVQIFQSSCRHTPTSEERALISRYTVNIGLSGPGGSLEAAQVMMQAAAAIVQAGGAGVFVDNSALAHGGKDWIKMTEDGSGDAMSFAFVSIVRGPGTTYTLGMQTMGFADLLMNAADIDEQGDTIIEIMRYICDEIKPVEVGHLFADEQGPRFQVVAKTSDDFDAQSPMHNPHGRLKIVSVKDLADSN
ncbi:hypothetical protein [Blastopirellula marina]|uniref:DUF4261 domain-containing protein n=1 Tax=Blastopirellula marina DSM 3645 TaxID=314230 RepID=A3ZRE1_9BACT|nr:hypothetical protein [Blastopirellula marina]EAQ80710.1 hypothetical protein DSM3645_11856 [Blastopirellula marina DSM 3645]